MKLAKPDLLAALRLRYDHYSAQSVFETALAKAGLDDVPEYDAKQVAVFRAALARVGDRLANVDARLDLLLDVDGGTPAEPPKPVAEVPASKPVAEVPPPKPVAEAPKPAAEVPPPKPVAAAPKLVVEPPLAPGIHEVEATPNIETTITLAGLDTEDGDEVLVCGGLPTLGDWDPEKARAMKREGAHWLATIAVPPGTDVPFKFLHRTIDGTVIWETGENRQLVPTPRIEATWR